MNRRNVVIVIVAVFAIAVGLVVYGVLLTPHKTAVPPRNVVIAAMNIPAHAHIVSAMVTTEQRPADQVETDALADPSDAIGMIATADIPQGAEITPTRIAHPAPPPQGLQIAVGLRAITIPIDNVKGIAGLLQPGDHVDILASPPRGNGNARAYAIVRDARVLAVGSQIAATPNPLGASTPGPGGAPTPPPAVTATLLVTPEEANIILANDLNSTIRLALRSPHEPARSLAAETIEYSQPATPAPQASSRGIPVISGDTVTAVQP
jgi:pilus assembly protein CpaB